MYLLGSKHIVADDSDLNLSHAFEDILRTVLLDTLESLNNYNKKLANYFVEHHPVLEPAYDKMKREKEETNVVNNHSFKRPEEPPKRTENSQLIKPGASPVSVELAEFIEHPQRNKMQAKNIATGSLTASKVASGAVHAKNIIADEVIVTGNSRQINQFRFNKNVKENQKSFSFQKHKSGNGFGFSASNKRQNKGRVLHESPAKDTIAHRRQYLGRRNEKSALSSFVNNKLKFLTGDSAQHEERNHMHVGKKFRFPTVPTLLRPPENKSIQPRIGPSRHGVTKKAHPKHEPIFVDWSDFEDTDEEYYYDDESASFEESSANRDTEFTAREIVAGSMYADSVKAKEVHVRNVIANDVVVSKTLG